MLLPAPSICPRAVCLHILHTQHFNSHTALNMPPYVVANHALAMLLQQVRFLRPNRNLALYLRIVDGSGREFGAPFIAPADAPATELSVILPWSNFLGQVAASGIPPPQFSTHRQ